MLAAVLLAAAVAGPPAGERHVMILGLDGVRTDALAAADTPHLDRLRVTGTFSDDCRILPDRFREADTSSGPGWSAILCGVWADKHGVLDNGFGGKRYDRFPHLFQRIKEALPDARTASFVTWEPIKKHIVSAADVSEAWPAKGTQATYVPEDARVSAAAAAEILTHGPTACVAYFGQADAAGHRFGFHPSVPEYLSAIQRVDAHVGTLLAAVAARRERGEKWLVVATTDHGGRGTGHGGMHAFEEVTRVWLIVSGDGAVANRRQEGPTALVDVAPTALRGLGVPLKPAWELDGRPVWLASP